jgi:recombinational DNA repair ATPase RecF
MNDQKIIELQIRDVLRVRAIHVFPDGSLIGIGGKNGQGKSSVLKAIWMALGGGEWIESEPIRRGASDGEVKLVLNDLIITRRFSTKSGPSLKVTAKDGTPIGSPQRLLDELINALSFDPSEFTTPRKPHRSSASWPVWTRASWMTNTPHCSRPGRRQTVR